MAWAEKQVVLLPDTTAKTEKWTDWILLESSCERTNFRAQQLQSERRAEQFVSERTNKEQEKRTDRDFDLNQIETRFDSEQ